MKTGIKDFCQIYKKSKDPYKPQTTQIRFSLEWQTKFNRKESFDMPIRSLSHIDLDNEDIEILYKKYSKKLEAEMQRNIEQIKNEYKDVL